MTEFLLNSKDLASGELASEDYGVYYFIPNGPLDFAEFSFANVICGVDYFATLCNLVGYLVSGGFRNITHFIHAGFCLMREAFDEKSFQNLHNIQAYSCKLVISRESRLTVMVKKTLLSPAFFR